MQWVVKAYANRWVRHGASLDLECPDCGWWMSTLTDDPVVVVRIMDHLSPRYTHSCLAEAK